MIGLTEARAALAAAVGKKGWDFVYDGYTIGSCYYYPLKDIPGHLDQDYKDSNAFDTSCLVGVALDILGVRDCPRDYVKTIDTSDDNWFKGKLTSEALDYFGFAQRLQDEGSTWGEALDKAEEFAECYIQAVS